MQRNRKLLAVTLASLLLFSAFAPSAMAAAAVANSDSGNSGTGNTGTVANSELSVSVETGAASDVTANSATLNGELTAVEGAENASVSFKIYEKGDESTTGTTTLGERPEGTFSTDVSGLSPDTTYVYVAQAEAESGNAEVEDTGAEVEFTTANAETGPQPLGVETADATQVTGNSATLNGDLTGVGNAEDVDVTFVYQASGNAATGNAQTVDAGSLSEAGSFSADLTGLENGTTYTYYAVATSGNAEVTGEEVSFTAGAAEEGGFEAPEGPFGQQLTAYIDYLRTETEKTGREFGHAVAAFATGENPGSDNRPDHAGPPEDRGPSADDEDDTERGPPEHAERGPPEDKGPNADDDAETEEEESDSEDDSEDGEEEDDDKGGPPEHAGPK